MTTMIPVPSPPPSAARALLWTLLFLLAAAGGHAWERNIHRQMVLDLLQMAPPDLREYFGHGPCNIARYAENADLFAVTQGRPCTVKPAAQMVREIEAAKAALWAASKPRPFELHALIHQVADLFSPVKRMNCLVDARSFYEQHDINAFPFGEGSFEDLLGAFTRPSLHALVVRSEPVAYIVSLNAALRLLRDYHAKLTGTGPPPASLALYRVNFVKSAFGGAKVWRSYETADVGADGQVWGREYHTYSEEGSAENRHYLNGCGLAMLGAVVMPGEEGTLVLANFHNNTPDPVAQANLLVDGEEVILPLELKGFGDALVFFSLGQGGAPRALHLVPPTNPVARLAVPRGQWAGAPEEAGVNPAVESIVDMRWLRPADILKSACGVTAPAKGAPPPGQ